MRSSPSDSGCDRSTGKVIAWDLPTRLFKWGLVLCVLNAWATNRYADERPYLHKWNGYAILVLLVFRLFWGIWGGSTARFSNFLVSPKAMVLFVADQWLGRKRRYLGHSPIAALMILALMFAVFAQAITGLFSADQDRLVVEGPLAYRLSDAHIHGMTSLHRVGFDFVLGLASVHILANLYYSLVSRQEYIQAMVTGRKTRAAYVDLDEAEPGSLATATACLLAAAAIVFGTLAGLGGALWH